MEKQDYEDVEVKQTQLKDQEVMEDELDSMEDLLTKGDSIEDQIANLDPETIALVKALLAREQAVAASLPAEEEDHTKVCEALYITGDKRFGLFVIKRKGSGRVPVILQDSFTEHDKAQLALDLYTRGILKPSGKWAKKQLEDSIEAKIKSFEA